MKPVTEQPNPHTRDIDSRSTLEIVQLINREDQTVPQAVARALNEVADAVDLIVERLKRGGRLLYVGTGTSGRLGVLDASECPPTFGVSSELVQGIIAGGDAALRRAVEAAEDAPAQAVRDLDRVNASASDAIVGISASGNTPYTVSAVEHARRIGAAAIAVTCNPVSTLAHAADVSIAVTVGPEAIAGSSRMKAGTAQKLILNMLSTATMIRLGLVYRNLMSNLVATNEKLRRRACAILAEEANIPLDSAEQLFRDAGQDLKLALVSARAGIPLDRARQLLARNQGSISRALEENAAGS